MTRITSYRIRVWSCTCTPKIKKIYIFISRNHVFWIDHTKSHLPYRVLYIYISQINELIRALKSNMTLFESGLTKWGLMNCAEVYCNFNNIKIASISTNQWNLPFQYNHLTVIGDYYHARARSCQTRVFENRSANSWNILCPLFTVF